MNIQSRIAGGFLTLVLATISTMTVSSQQLASPSSRATTLPSISIITTLYSNDPIAHSLCFADGQEGGVMDRTGVFNRCSHIEFDAYKTGNLSVGIEGGEIGRIIDLGTAYDLSKRYGYSETMSGGQGFASIEFRDGKVLILDDSIVNRKDRFRPPRQELSLANQLFENNQSVSSAEAKAGHIYLARIADTRNKDFQILVKVLVLTARPGESVTFRWELL